MEWESGEAVDVLADGVVIFDRNETVVLVNRAAEQLFGVDRSKVVGAQFVDVFSLTSNDGRTWLEYNAPFEGPQHPHRCPRAVVGAARRQRVPGHGADPCATSRWVRPRVWPSPSAPVAVGPGSTASGPTWSPRWPTSCGRR